MEHAKPEVLFGLTLDWLRVERLARPGITVIERAVAQGSTHCSIRQGADRFGDDIGGWRCGAA